MSVVLSTVILQWRRNHGGSGGWCPRENCHYSRVYPCATCTLFIPTSIALSCSARTDVLSCSVGTDGAERQVARFFCQQTSSVFCECFFLFFVSAFSCLPLFSLLLLHDFCSGQNQQFLCSYSSAFLFEITFQEHCFCIA